MLKGGIRPTQNSKVTDPQIIYNQEIQQFVKSHFLQQKKSQLFCSASYEKNVYSFELKTFWGIFHKKIDLETIC